MDYEKLKQRMLAENDLMYSANCFLKDEDQVYWIDRHALDGSGHDYDPDALDPATIKLGVMLGLDLLRHWSEQRKSLTSLYVSEPFLSIDEEWILGRVNPAPPSVLMCLAKTEEAFWPVTLEGTVQRDLTLDEDVDLIGTKVEFIERYDDPEEDEIFGAWLIYLDGENLKAPWAPSATPSPGFG